MLPSGCIETMTAPFVPSKNNTSMPSVHMGFILWQELDSNFNSKHFVQIFCDNLKPLCSNSNLNYPLQQLNCAKCWPYFFPAVLLTGRTHGLQVFAKFPFFAKTFDTNFLSKTEVHMNLLGAEKFLTIVDLLQYLPYGKCFKNFYNRYFNAMEYMADHTYVLFMYFNFYSPSFVLRSTISGISMRSFIPFSIHLPFRLPFFAKLSRLPSAISQQLSDTVSTAHIPLFSDIFIFYIYSFLLLFIASHFPRKCIFANPNTSLRSSNLWSMLNMETVRSKVAYSVM